MILSAVFNVLNRWAIMSVVRLRSFITRWMAKLTSFSDAVSNALVASSSINNLGCRIKARAMASRWRWPPLSCIPLGPIRVSNCWGKAWIKSKALASRAQCSRAEWGTSLVSPYVMLLAIVPLSKAGSWGTSPKFDRHDSGVKALMFSSP